MNERFFLLPQEKQNAIINAGFQVFSANTYKKTPVSEIAENAGISKALLFHYFHNKKELYVYLFTYAKQITHLELERAGTPKSADFFTLLEVNLRVKCNLTRKYPFVSAFTMRAFYEQEPEIKAAIQHVFADTYAESSAVLKMSLAHANLRAGVDHDLMYQEITWALDGYLHTVYLSGEIVADKMERDLSRLIAFWKNVYQENEV